MSDFNATDYVQILIRSIRKGVMVPFDCYLFLQANNRIIRYVGKDNTFPDSKLAKLEQHAFTNLYIRREDLAVYEDYLRVFLSSPEGVRAIGEIANSASDEEIQGIPKNVAEEFGSLLAPLKLAADFVSETVGAVQGAAEDQAPESGAVTAQDAQPLEDGALAAQDPPSVEPAVDLEAAADTDSDVSSNEELPVDPEVDEPVDLRSQILNVIKSQVTDLEDQFQAGGNGGEEDDLTLIRRVTEKIREEMTRVRGKGEEPPDETVIREVTQNVNLEIQRIRGLAERVEPERAEKLNAHAAELNTHLETLTGLLNNKKSAEEKLKISADAAEGIDDGIWEIKRLYQIEDEDIDAAGVVGNAIAGMIAGLEDILGVQIEVQPGGTASDAVAREYLGLIEEILASATEFRPLVQALPDPEGKLHSDYDDLFGKITELHRLCSDAVSASEELEPESEEEAENGASEHQELQDASDGEAEENVPAEFAKRLAALVSDQERVILDLSSRLSNAKSIYGDILRKWEEIQNKSRTKFNSSELKLAQSLSDDFRSFGSLYLGANAASISLKDLTDRLADEVGAEKSELEPSDEQGDTKKRGIVQPNLEEEEEEGGIKSAADLDIPDGPREGASDEEVRSEYKLLLVQLQNAKSLLESNEKKIGELSRAHSQTANYAEGIEKELGEKTTLYERFREKADELEAKGHRMREAMDSADRNVLLAREEVRAKDEVIRNLNDKVIGLDKELRQYRALFKDVEGKSLVDTATLDKMAIPDDLKAHIKDLETHLRRYEAEIESKRGEIRELRKDIVKLNGKVQDNTLLKQQMAQKLDKIKLDIDTSRRAETAMNRKISLVTNLLDESRKTIGKLTGVNDELRRDRMEYMAKTNQAMRDYKDMMSKANSLDRHVQAEIQRNQSLGGQNELLKEKQREFATRAAELQKENIAMDAEIKRLKRLVESAGGAIGSGEVNPLVLQRRIEELEKEKKTISKWYAEEKKKVAALSEQLKKFSSAA